MDDLIPHSGYPLFEPTTQFLIRMCKAFKPATILDAGAGMTSVLLRKYNPLAHVVSVDTNEEYLHIAKELLRRFDLPKNSYKKGQFLSWDTFLALRTEYTHDHDPFDFICHDLGNMETRLKTLPAVLDLAAPKSAILLDNLGVTTYKVYALPLLIYRRFDPLSPATIEGMETLTPAQAGTFGAFTRKWGR